MIIVRKSNSQRFDLQDRHRLGSGGEAVIFQWPGDSALAAKIYHRPDKDKKDKIEAMLANPPVDTMRAQGHVSIAWPTDTLTDATGLFKGFLMPVISEPGLLIDFYNPASRRKVCPDFSYLYMMQTARNIAIAFQAVHAKGYVVGDVNESNILVQKTALVTLVDCDSFQVHAPGLNSLFRCPVGKPEFTPPELQGISFKNIDRSELHDQFGLAVIIFLLLMEGNYPFMGVYSGPGEPPSQEDNIRNGSFPYSLKASTLKPRPHAPSFDLLAPHLQSLFRQCFNDGHASPGRRPSAQDWNSALEESLKNLKKCATNSQHLHGSHLRFCPWCERAKQFRGRDSFPSIQSIRAGSHLNKPAPIPTQTALPRAGQQAINPVINPVIYSQTAPTLAQNPPVQHQRTQTPVSGGKWIGRFAVLAIVIGVLYGGWNGFIAPGLAKIQSPSNPFSNPSTPNSQAIANLETKTNKKDGAAMVLIPAGTFQLGDDDKSNNKPHKVTLSAYWIYKNPVTVEEYEKFVNAKGRAMPSATSANPNWERKNDPIQNVSYDDASAYCKWAGVRLPTEAEWEHAARGPDGRKYPWGNEEPNKDNAGNLLWSSLDNSKDGTTSVGKYGISPYGCSDMAGNVGQWCSDWYDDKYCNEDRTDPKGPASGQYRVLRGGSWYFDVPVNFRASFRFDSNPSYHISDFGFRCAAGH